MTTCLSPVPGLETPKKPSEQGTSLAAWALCHLKASLAWSSRLSNLCCFLDRDKPSL